MIAAWARLLSAASTDSSAPERGGGVEPTVERSATVGKGAWSDTDRASPRRGRRKTQGASLLPALRRPLRGLSRCCVQVTHSSASLHCGLYSVAPSGGWRPVQGTRMRCCSASGSIARKTCGQGARPPSAAQSRSGFYPYRSRPLARSPVPIHPRLLGPIARPCYPRELCSST